MKSLFRIISRYSLSAGVIIGVILLSNFAAVVYFGYVTSTELQEKGSLTIRETMELVGTELEERSLSGAKNQEKKRYELSGEGMETLTQSGFLWAMAMDLEGDVVWEWKLPDEIPRSYTIQDVASFSRWYLCDYPVRVWRYDNLLLVFGNDPELESRHSIFMSLEFVRKLPFYVKVLFAVNVGVILFFVLCFGWRFYRSLKPVAQGIEQLAAGEPLHLKEKGTAGELAGKLNQTSRILERQNLELARRDEARTQWISGVSHDIRTPLALILGHADRLSESGALSAEEQAMVQSIRRQGLIIRQLIQDLNLTSKLTYQSQSLRRERCSMALILRECAADLYNEGPEQNFEIAVSVTAEAEQRNIYADKALLARALRNLLGNSIRHNPEGCYIEAELTVSGEQLCCFVRDTGRGIPETVVKNMTRPDSEIHIMGLRLADQIARAHGGELVFHRRDSGTYDAEIKIAPE